MEGFFATERVQEREKIIDAYTGNFGTCHIAKKCFLESFGQKEHVRESEKEKLSEGDVQRARE